MKRTLCRPGSARLRTSAFTLVELLVTASVITIVTGITFRSTMVSFLQEQRLRQAAFELASYFQSARARAQREDGICQLVFSGTTIAPSLVSDNRCATPPALPGLDLAQISGVSGLTLSSASLATPITFGRNGTLASQSLTNRELVRLFYLAASGTTHQRCVFLDLVEIRVGWRQGSSGFCTYTRS